MVPYDRTSCSVCWRATWDPLPLDSDADLRWWQAEIGRVIDADLRWWQLEGQC